MSPAKLYSILEAIPELPGSYALHLRLDSPRSIPVGRLGLVAFTPGEYLYLGSAMGGGGLRARLGRHLKGTGRPRWHIDALRTAALPSGAWWTEIQGQEMQNPRLECCWSQALAGIEGAEYPAPGFGASDCQSGCAAHLLGFPTKMEGLKGRIERVLESCLPITEGRRAAIVYVDAGTIGESCS